MTQKTNSKKRRDTQDQDLNYRVHAIFEGAAFRHD